MTLVCGVDPGTDSPGFSVYCTQSSRWLWHSDQPPPFRVDVVAVESGWAHGPMGKLAMWGLGFRAAMQLLSVPLNAGGARYRVSPDAWREALPHVPGTLPIRARSAKAVTVNRLRLRYGWPQGARLVEGPQALELTDDIVESRGIAEGVVALLARPLKRDRKGLVAVR